jgi:DNA-binding PadR family transcriptional regulator
MYKTVLFTGSSRRAGDIAPFMSRRYGADETLVVCMGGLAAPVHFDYPHGNSLQAYPYVSEPEYLFVDAGYLQARTLRTYAASDFRTVDPLPAYQVRQAIAQAERFVFADDPSPGPAHGFFTVLDVLGAKYSTDNIDAYAIYDFRDGTLEKAVEAGCTGRTRAILLRQAERGRVKRYLDWNYDVNALAVLRAPLKAAGLPDDAVISKFELQLLYFVANLGDTSELTLAPKANVLRRMNRWEGTGRYSGRVSLGSPASRYPIVENLLEKGFLEERRYVGGDPVVRYTVTEKGREFLALLHPDCEDPDLPFRILLWQDMEFAEAQQKIDRYVRTFFGKQKRFNLKKRAVTAG